MPYDGNGNYVRVHNWTADAANSLDINATEMDQEDNGFAAALSNAVTRDGQGKMGVDFLPNADNTLNLGNGSLRWATINGLPINSIISGIFYARTAAEITAGVTPTVFTLPPGSLRRYGADPTGVTNSQPALLAALKCNADVFDDFPGGGTYLLNAETVIASYPVTIRGQAPLITGNAVNNTGTQFKLATAAGAGAAILRATAFTAGLRIKNIGFAFQTNTTGQIALRFSLDLRYSIIESCTFTGGGTGGLSTTIGIQLDGGGTVSADVIIRDNYFNSGLLTGIWLKGNCTTIKIYGNELYGYGGAAGVANGSGIQMDYPVTEPAIALNYFEGWTNGINSNGAAYVKQIGNDYAANTNDFTWTKTTYTYVRNISSGETHAGGGAAVFSSSDADGNAVLSQQGYFLSGGSVQSTRGFQEGNGSTLRSYNAGYPQAVTFAAGNFTGSGSMTYVVILAGQTVFWFSIVGKTLTVNFNISGTVGGTPNTALQIAVPGGFAATSFSLNSLSVFNNGAWGVGACQVAPGVGSGAIIQIFNTPAGSANWTAGTAIVSGQLQMQVG